MQQRCHSQRPPAAQLEEWLERKGLSQSIPRRNAPIILTHSTMAAARACLLSPGAGVSGAEDLGLSVDMLCACGWICPAPLVIPCPKVPVP